MVLSLCVGLLCEMKFGQEELCMRILGNVKSESVILFGKVCVWVLVLLFTICAQRHHSRARRRGYLRFYRQMQPLKDLPFTVHSAGTRSKSSPHGGSNVKGCVNMCVNVCVFFSFHLCAGCVLLLALIAAPVPAPLHTYLLLSILGLELLVAFPCLLYYTGIVISVTFLVGLQIFCLVRRQM